MRTYLLAHLVSKRMLTRSAHPPHHFFFLSIIFAKPQNVPFSFGSHEFINNRIPFKTSRLDKMDNTLLLSCASPSEARAHTQACAAYIALTVMCCEIGWEGWIVVFVDFRRINLGHGIDYRPTRVTLTLIDARNPTPLINYTCFMKMNLPFKLVNDHSVEWCVV